MSGEKAVLDTFVFVATNVIPGGSARRFSGIV